MKIAKVIIKNYRLFEKFDYQPDRINVLIGGNNSGKTTIFEALRLALDPYIPWYREDIISEFDYHNCDTNTSIEIEVIFNDLSNLELAYFDEYLEGIKGNGEIVDISETPAEALDKNKTIVRIKFNCSKIADVFKSETIYLKPALNGKTVSREDKKRIGFLYISSRRDPLRELSFYRDSIFAKLFEKHNLSEKIQEIIKNLSKEPEKLYEIEAFKKGFEELRKTVARLRFIEDKPENMGLGLLNLSERKVLGGLNLMLRSPESKKVVPIEQQGSGVQSAVLIASIMRIIAEEKNQNLILAFEEPEQKLEPHNQRLIIKNLLLPEASRTQIFVTTHSAEIVRACPFESLQVVKNAKYIKCVKECPIENRKFFERYQRNQIVEGMFSKGILLVEGATEKGGLPEFFKKLEEQNKFCGLEELGVELVDGGEVEGGGIGMLPKYGRFFKNILELPVISLIDCDIGDPNFEEKKKEVVNSSSLTLVYPSKEGYRNYEEIISTEANPEALVNGLELIAKNKDFEGVKRNIAAYLENVNNRVYEKYKKDIFRLKGFKDILRKIWKLCGEKECRKIIYHLISDKGSLLKCKSTMEARVIACAVSEQSVPRTFEKASKYIQDYFGERIERSEIILD